MRGGRRRGRASIELLIGGAVGARCECCVSVGSPRYIVRSTAQHNPVSFLGAGNGPGPWHRGGDMLEFYLQSARGIARARSSLVGPYLDGFAAVVRELGYCRLVGQWCITYAVHLGLWAAAA